MSERPRHVQGASPCPRGPAVSEGPRRVRGAPLCTPHCFQVKCSHFLQRSLPGFDIGSNRILAASVGGGSLVAKEPSVSALRPGDCGRALPVGFPFLARSQGRDVFPCSFAFTLPGFRAPVRGVPSVPSSQPVVLLLVCSDSGVRLWVKCSVCLHRPVCGDGALQSDSRDPGWFLRKPVPLGSSHPFHPNVNDAGCQQPVQTVGGTRKEEGEEEENGSVIYTDVYLLLEAAHRRLQAEARCVSTELQLVLR